MTMIQIVVARLQKKVSDLERVNAFITTHSVFFRVDRGLSTPVEDDLDLLLVDLPDLLVEGQTNLKIAARVFDLVEENELSIIG